MEMAEARNSSEVEKFINWLEQLVHTSGVSRAQLGQHLGAGSIEQIEADLSRAYLPSWGYVLATYLGPIEKFVNTPVPAQDVAEGKRLYKEAALVATPSLPGRGGDEGYSRAVAPVLAGLSLPAIVSLATATTPGKLPRDVALSFLIMATGFFLASFQLTLGSVYVQFYNWGTFRAGLSVAGIVCVMVALIVLVGAVAGYSWSVIAMAVLVLGGSTQLLVWGLPKLRIGRRPVR